MKFENYIKEIDANKELKKEYLTNDIIKIRVHSLLNKGLPKCTYHDCNLPIDYTEGLGFDTSCPYHRLLFDHWLYGIAEQKISTYSKRGRRIAFTRWCNKTGKKQCDKIVDEMSKDGINWKC